MLFRHVGRVAGRIRSTAVRSAAWHHQSDAITSLFAFIGISIALLKGWAAADDWAALGAALVILYQHCPEDDCGSPPNALGGKGLDVIVVFFDLKSDRSKRPA
jgi:hypothetical protein